MTCIDFIICGIVRVFCVCEKLLVTFGTYDVAHPELLIALPIMPRRRRRVTKEENRHR